MKPNDLVLSFVYFFNDLIGAIIPGLFLVAGLFVIHSGTTGLSVIKGYFDSAWFAVLALFILFAVGHGLGALHMFVDTCVKRSWKRSSTTDAKKSAVVEVEHLLEDLLKKRISKELEFSGSEDINRLGLQFERNDLRNMAMTISPIAGNLARRFMFLALLCHGVGTAIWTIAIYTVFLFLAFPSNATVFAGDCKVFSIYIVLSVLIGALFFYRGNKFRATSLAAPFTVALSEILYSNTANATED